MSSNIKFQFIKENQHDKRTGTAGNPDSRPRRTHYSVNRQGVFMEEIKEILGSSCNTYFKMTNGQIFVASSEFRAKSGEIDGFIVYKEGIKDYNTGIALTQQEISELVEQYEKYTLTHTDVVAWAWLD